MMRFLAIPCFVFFASCVTNPGSATDGVVPENRKERQMIGLLEKFDRWDYNGDGQLTKAELDKADRSTQHTSEEILAFYDTDKSGGISLREAQTGFARAVKENRAE